MQIYQQSPQQVIETLKSDPKSGLSQAEAKTRLAQYGLNELIERGILRCL